MASCRLFSTQQPEGSRWDTHQSRTLICTKKAKLPIITYKAPQDLALITCLASFSTTPSQHPGCSSACQGCSYLRDMPRPLLSVIPQMVPEFIPSLPSLKVTLSMKLLQWPYLTFITRTIQHFLPHFTLIFFSWDLSLPNKLCSLRRMQAHPGQECSRFILYYVSVPGTMHISRNLINTCEWISDGRINIKQSFSFF